MKVLHKICFLAVLLCTMLLSSCSGENPLYEIFESDTEKSLDASRPEGATALPDFSGEISDVRVTTIQRNIDIPDGAGKEWDIDFANLEFRQIYYGYCSDGVWTDLPCENYELVSIFNPIDYQTGELVIKRGYEAVEDDHMVKIGPYLLFSIDARMGKDGLLTPKDSIGSEMELLFAEYDRYNLPEEKAKFGFIKEDRASILAGWELEFRAVSNLEVRYVLVLKYDEIPTDYQLWTELDSGQKRSLLTYDDIQFLLDDQ